MTKEDRHIASINLTIVELHQLHARTAAPQPIQHQYIGTIVDSILVMLCAAGNSLDGNNRRASFSQFDNWLGLMTIIHRTFLSSIHTATENGLLDYCKTEKIQPTSSTSKRMNTLIDKIDGNSQVVEKLKKLTSMPPSFSDILNAVFKHSSLTNEKVKKWRDYFDALSILRNKSSHADVRLTPTEAQKLSECGFNAMLDINKQIQINPTRYSEITQHILDFFDELLTGPKKT